MTFQKNVILLPLVALSLTACQGEDPPSNPPAETNNSEPDMQAQEDAQPDMDTRTRLRVATFNTSLFRDQANGLSNQLEGASPQADEVARILARINPDVVLLNEFDWDVEGLGIARFQERFLEPAGLQPFDFVFIASSNTGLPSGFDLDQNGEVVTVPGSQAYGNDSFGFGLFEGQYSFVVLSRFPITGTREFKEFLWSDMPDSLLPRDYYGEASDALRLSSKNHVDVTVNVAGVPVHVLASHPTPPSFDGPEDRNGRRNHDEIRLWLDYINNETYLVDDAGTEGGLADEAFVILGDLNSDPKDGDSERGALLGLLEHPKVQDPEPKSDGAVAKAEEDGRANDSHEGDPALDTADFSDNQVGNLRVDYVLPSTHFEIIESGVFWPAGGGEGAELRQPSDHRLVWVDLYLDAP
ncbi:endonuclease/exonuclease/phosphatase family protein [Microvenator marinus]|uniref:Endonuclease/exonuclease/phosphatase family protein n=1 Tax=Microvenator marinus TaxID=2600177 RepID=A0A5B8XR78_9DELT|nr:endonuclease/exonuclease/phosphatase family protein [Microvenator marinus]QED27657.1 endonuclease/exonuclease/phosphatase family protein [Microvenator marinus]